MRDSVNVLMPGAKQKANFSSVVTHLADCLLVLCAWMIMGCSGGGGSSSRVSLEPVILALLKPVKLVSMPHTSEA